MIWRKFLWGIFFAIAASGDWRPIPGNLWVQVAFVPPGTNDTRRTETIPGATLPASTATGLPTNPAGPVAAGRLPEQQSTPAPKVPQLPSNCKVTLAAAETSVAPTGGPVVFASRFAPPNCATEPVSNVPWIQRKAGSRGPGFTFNVDANSKKTPREGALRVGDVSMTVKQAGGKFAPFAAAPGRVEFSVDEKLRKPPAKQTIAAWSEDSASGFAATTSTPWLKVTPIVRNGTAAAQKFTVEVAPATLKPGRHEGSIEIKSPGVVNDPIRIPVIVTVAGKPK